MSKNKLVITNWQYDQVIAKPYIRFPNGLYYLETRVILEPEDLEDYVSYINNYNPLFANTDDEETSMVTAMFGNPPTLHHWYFTVLSDERKRDMQRVYISTYELN
jgi:hypothetical protein